MPFRFVALATIPVLMSVSPALAKAHTVDATTLDVAGVKLGMTPEEARQALNASGYSVGADLMSESWNARVASEAGKYANTPKDGTRAVYATDAEGPEYQKVTVTYEITSSGSHARKIEYSRPGIQGDILALVRGKYGVPTRESWSTYHYCAIEKTCPSNLSSDAPEPFLEAYSSNSGRSSIVLSQGQVARERWESAFAAAVREKAPNYGKASF